MIISHYGEENLQADELPTPNFEVSWAGSSPWRPGYCFGSDDGRVQFTNADTTWWDGPYDVSPSGEAVNGVAFAGGLMAVSTRNDITFLNVPHPGEGQVERAVYNGGAHGAIATQDGGIVAPMGRRGILLMGPTQEHSQRVRVLTAVDEALYIYKLVTLSDPARGTVLVCAGRQGGLASMPLSGNRLESYGKRLRPANVDFVDVAALSVEGYPFAAAGLGLDCSIHLMRDLLTDRTSKRIHFSPPNERAYRILCTEGHVFLLTDKALYGFFDLAREFVEGRPIDGLTFIRKLDMEAVDFSITDDRFLLVVMPETVYRIAIDSFIARDGVKADESGLLSPSTPKNGSVPTSSWVESMETIDTPAWERSEELELAPVA